MIKKLMTICICATMFLGNFSVLADEQPKIVFEAHWGRKVVPFLQEMFDLQVRSFGRYPYLYAPSQYMIVSPHDTMFANEIASFVISAKEDDDFNDEYIAIAAGIYFDSPYLYEGYFPESLKEQFIEKGFDPSKMFYINYFLISPEYPEYLDDEKVVLEIYNAFASFAKYMGLKQICYMEIIQDDSHPLKPDPYIPPEPWGRGILPIAKKTDITLELNWPTLQPDQSEIPQNHLVSFYIIDL